MGEDKTDFEILMIILYDYAWRVPEIRRMLAPSIMSTILSRILYVKATSTLRKIAAALPEKNTQLYTVAFYGICIFLNVILTELSSLYTCKAGVFGYKIANQRTYNYFLNLYPVEFSKIGKGEMQNTMSRYATGVQDVLDILTLYIMPFIATIVISMLSIVPILGPLTGFVILFTVCLYIIITIKITIWRNKIIVKINKLSDTSQNVLNDGLNNFETIFAFGTENYETKRYGKYLNEVQNHRLLITRTKYLLNAAQGSVWALQLFLIIAVQCIIIRLEEASEITYIVSIVSMFHSSLNNLGFMYGKYKTGMVNIRRTNLKIRSKKHSGFRKVTALKHQIAVYDLSFTYNNKMILDCASFLIKKGEKVAIIGANGAGKSTLLKSLLKYNEVDAQIFIDEFNSDDISDSSYKDLMSYVPQNCTLFDESVIYNIKYANPNIYDEQVFKLAIKMGFHEAFSSLENGYHTLCGENGSALSGGERQKIALLRALMRNSPILLMDEPTANMDRVSEQQIFENLAQTKDLTVISIIHNHNLLPLFDRVLKVKNGKVSEFNLDIKAIK